MSRLRQRAGPVLVEEQQETEAESEESRSGRGQEEDVRRKMSGGFC